MNAPLSFEAYQAVDAINWSTLKHLATSPRLLRWRADHERPDTRALARGRAIHCAVFEPDRWAREYIVEPDFGNMNSNAAKAARAKWLAKLGADGVPRPHFDGRTKAGKEEKAQFIASLPEGAQILVGDERADDVLPPEITAMSADEHALAERCAAAVREHPKAAELLRAGRPEEVITWTDTETGVACKGRVDWIAPRFVLDLKSTRQQTLRGIFSDFARLLYHGQIAFYSDGALASGAIPLSSFELPRVIAVQTVEPYDVAPISIGTMELNEGRELYRSLLRKYEQCRAADWWPGIAPDLTELELPRWAPGAIDDEGDDW